MSFNAAFSIAVTSDPRVIVLSDSSTGSDGSLIDRKVSLFRSDGTLLSPIITWPIAQNTLTLPILLQDVALNISIFWNSSSPLAPPSTYTASKIYAFNGYGNAFMYYLTQLLSAKPFIMQDKGYWENKLRLQVEIDSSQNAINVGGDLYGADNCISRYNAIIKNAQYNF